MTGVTLVTVTTVTGVTEICKGDFSTVSSLSMAGIDEKPRLVEWNLRGFPEDLRAACQKIALDERSEKGKRPKDADVVARLIRQALGIPQLPRARKAKLGE